MSDPGTQLTPRELELLHLLCTGAPMKAAALKLGISDRTGDAHVHNIRKKIGLKGRSQVLLVRWYARNFPERVGIQPVRQLTSLELDAPQLLETVRGLIHGDARAMPMARLLVHRHREELREVRVAVEGDL